MVASLPKYLLDIPQKGSFHLSEHDDLLKENEKLKKFEESHKELLGKSINKIDIWADPEERNRMLEFLEKDGRYSDFEVKVECKN